MTFHSLGRLILTRCNKSIRLSGFVDASIKQQWMSNWLTEKICHDRSFLNLFVKLISQPANVFDYNNKQSYLDSQNTRYQSLAGYHVASYQELLIANWLCINGVKHQYKSAYKNEVKLIGISNKKKTYQANFYLNDVDVYLESLGVLFPAACGVK
ncbi:MAG: hypothetical protein GY787_11515 [Alteromonadales bacterium]|nr:hypothetical protein [Alteromonadales bacterium]